MIEDAEQREKFLADFAEALELPATFGADERSKSDSHED
jgi:hypothetical protein